MLPWGCVRWHTYSRENASDFVALRICSVTRFCRETLQILCFLLDQLHVTIWFSLFFFQRNSKIISTQGFCFRVKIFPFGTKFFPMLVVQVMLRVGMLLKLYETSIRRTTSVKHVHLMRRQQSINKNNEVGAVGLMTLWQDTFIRKQVFRVLIESTVQGRGPNQCSNLRATCEHQHFYPLEHKLNRTVFLLRKITKSHVLTSTRCKDKITGVWSVIVLSSRIFIKDLLSHLHIHHMNANGNLTINCIGLSHQLVCGVHNFGHLMVVQNRENT